MHKSTISNLDIRVLSSTLMKQGSHRHDKLENMEIHLVCLCVCLSTHIFSECERSGEKVDKYISHEYRECYVVVNVHRHLSVINNNVAK